MKNLSPIDENKDIIDKKYVDDGLASKSNTGHTHLYAGSSSSGGPANSAVKLQTTRTIQTDLSSTTAANFNGSENIKPGVTGTLPVENGGTGKTSMNESANAFINSLDEATGTPTDNANIITQQVNAETTVYYRRPLSIVWEYIKNKISSVLGLTLTNYNGKSATATKLATARTIDGINFDGSANISHYGTCATAGETAAKVVSCTGFTLSTGARISVVFTNINTANAITLNVNGTGAKPVYQFNEAMTSSNTKLYTGMVYDFVYNGTSYQFINDQRYVWQEENTTDNNDYELLISSVNTESSGTGFTKKSKHFLANPSTGKFYSYSWGRSDITGQTIDLNDYNGSDGTYHTRHIRCRTTIGSSNITNRPSTTGPFILDIDVIRWSTTVDYITRQVYVTTNTFTTEYVRFCVNGTWTSWVSRVFTDTTYSAATTSTAGLMSSSDKTKLNSIDTDANNYTLPSAGAALGGVKTGGDVSISNGVITVSDDSHNHIINNIDGLQTELDSKASSTHTHLYAGSSTAGGAATSATKMATARTIDGINFDGSANISHYGTCATAGETAAKVVSCTGFTLSTGSRISVKFNITNTADNITLNVNSTGAKAVYYSSSAMTNITLRILNGIVYDFIYDGTNYRYVGAQHYVMQYINTEDKNFRLLFSGTDTDQVETYVTRKSSNFTANPATGTLGAKYFNASSGGQRLYSNSFDNVTLVDITISDLWNYSLLIFKIATNSKNSDIPQSFDLIIPVQYINNGNAYTANQNIITSSTDYRGAIRFVKSSTANTISINTYTNTIATIAVYSVF